MPDDVGSLADEAARLAAAVQGWARGEGSGRASAYVGHMATGDPACCVCPVCNLVVVLRGERPELTDRLVESLTGLVTAGQGLLDTLTAVAADARAATPATPRAAGNGAAGNGAGNNGASSNGSAGDDGSPSGPRPASPRVQNIPLD